MLNFYLIIFNSYWVIWDRRLHIWPYLYWPCISLKRYHRIMTLWWLHHDYFSACVLKITLFMNLLKLFMEQSISNQANWSGSHLTIWSDCRNLSNLLIGLTYLFPFIEVDYVSSHFHEWIRRRLFVRRSKDCPLNLLVDSNHCSVSKVASDK